jgi:hypothetical protein
LVLTFVNECAARWYECQNQDTSGPVLAFASITLRKTDAEGKITPFASKVQERQ